MNCDEYLDHVTKLLKSHGGFESERDEGQSSTSANECASCREEGDLQLTVSNLTNFLVVPIIGMFGVLGNSLNLLVLTRRQSNRRSSIERSYNSGLVAVAAADLIICLSYSLKATTNFDGLKGPKESNLPAYFSAYAEPIINVAIFASTWFTTAVAVSRYVAICRPLHARSFVNPRAVRLTVAAILIGAVVVNVPRFLRYRVVVTPCAELFAVWEGDRVSNSTATAIHPFDLSDEEGAAASIEMKKLSDFYEKNEDLVRSCPCSYSHKVFYFFFDDPDFRSAYNLSATVVTILVPLAIMIFCNFCFVKALRRSFAMRRVFRSKSSSNSTSGAGRGGGGGGGGRGGGRGGGNQSSAYCVVTTVTRVREGDDDQQKVTNFTGGSIRSTGSERYSGRRKMLEIKDDFARSGTTDSNAPESPGQSSIVLRGDEKLLADKKSGFRDGKTTDKGHFLASDKSKVVSFKNFETDEAKHAGTSSEKKDGGGGGGGGCKQRNVKQQTAAADDHYITPTLITLILFFVLLVTPSELLGIFQAHIMKEEDTTTSYRRLRTAVDISNCFHLLNFSINVVLYSIINVKFRRTTKKIFCYICCCRRCRQRSYGDFEWKGFCGRRQEARNSESEGIDKMQMTSAMDNQK